MDSIVVRPIGVVRSQIKDRKLLPPLGVSAAVEVFPEFAAGLLRFEKHSHVWVIVWLDEAARDTLQVTPRGVRDQGPDGLHGVFAVRSPTRSNPIGLTLARVLERQDNLIRLDRLDFVDGTPVIDLKPYFVTKDMVFSASNAQIGKPASPEAVRESLLTQAIQFHGEQCPDLELAVEIAAHFRTAVLDYDDPPEWRLRVPLERPHLIDAFMGMTRASPGRGTLRFAAGSCVLIEHAGRGYRYDLVENGWRPPAGFRPASS